MKTVILKQPSGEEVYINPNYVVSITGSNDGVMCKVETVNGGTFMIYANKHTVASILATEPTRPDKFVSYKDWE